MLCSFCPEPPAASCRLTPISSFLWEVSLGIREGSQVPQPNFGAPPHWAPVLSGGPSAALCLSEGAELLKGSSVSFMAMTRCQAQASLGINSQELLVKLDYVETSLRSQISRSPPAPFSSPTAFSAGPPYQATRDMA